MSYHTVKMHLSLPQAKRLMDGSGIRIVHSSIGAGKYDIHLTKRQHTKVMGAYGKGKGCQISLDAKQIKHHIKQGGGLD